MPYDGHVAGAEAFAQSGLVLLERDVEDPIQAVLNAPVAAHGVCGARRIEAGRGDTITRLAVRLTGSFDLGLDLDQAGHTRQPEFAGEATIAGQPVDLANDADLAPLDAAVALSCSMWLAILCGGASMKHASVSARRLGWLAFTASR
jgi:hypothetical protein